MKRAEVFNVRMNKQKTPAKQKKETNALLGMMRDIINTHTQPESDFEAFRIVKRGDSFGAHMLKLVIDHCQLIMLGGLQALVQGPHGYEEQRQCGNHRGHESRQDYHPPGIRIQDNEHVQGLGTDYG